MTWGRQDESTARTFRLLSICVSACLGNGSSPTEIVSISGWYGVKMSENRYFLSWRSHPNINTECVIHTNVTHTGLMIVSVLNMQKNLQIK